MLSAEGAHLILSQVRMHLDLVDRGDNLGLTVQPPQVMGLEVGHADGPGPAFAVELLQRPPGLHEVTAVPARQRPVDQEQVDVLGAESLERPCEGLAGIVGLVRVVAQLAGDEDLTAVEARPGDGVAYFGLVAVHLGGVDVPVPGLERRAHRGRRVLRRDLKDTEAELRNGLAVVQPDIRNGSHEELSSRESLTRTRDTLPRSGRPTHRAGLGDRPLRCRARAARLMTGPPAPAVRAAGAW